MNVVKPATVDEFLDRASGFLLADEPRNNLILGIASTIASTDIYDGPQFWIVEHDGEVRAAALRTPPHKLVLSYTTDLDAAAALRDAIDDCPGVTGLLPAVEVFMPASLVTSQGVYALERVEEVPQPEGAARVATVDDRETVLRWLHEFHAEVGSSIPTNERVLDLRLAGNGRGLLLWEAGGRPVSLAGWGGNTPNGIRIGPVYTPPHLRGRGYATALVAELSQRMLDGGRRFCFLYTDLANPTSNAVYERIGYVRIAESCELEFS